MGAKRRVARRPAGMAAISQRQWEALNARVDALSLWAWSQGQVEQAVAVALSTTKPPPPPPPLRRRGRTRTIRLVVPILTR